MDDDNRRISDLRIRRIAAALGIPVEGLFTTARTSRPSPDEVEDIVAAFSLVRDPDVRSRCIAFVRAASSADDVEDRSRDG